MNLDAAKAKILLGKFDFTRLFTEELGWDRLNRAFTLELGGATYALRAVAEKRGMAAVVYDASLGQKIPDRATRRKIEMQVAKTYFEHLIVFTDAKRSEQIWCWALRETGKPVTVTEHFWYASSGNRGFLQKLQAIAFSLVEEESLTLLNVTARARAAFDVERVTKRFYDQFKTEHTTFLGFISGIIDMADHEWYASLMLNRLMFIYFMQRKGFLNQQRDYLRERLGLCQREKGQDKFYSFYRYFLLRLFHEGLGGKARNPELEKLLGRIPYLNGGLFEKHSIEERYLDIKIPDEAFSRIFTYFDRYQWHLDERPLRNDNEINPDVLGYIFEKYINQKQMGAYYTKEDITEYITKSTVIPFLFDAARAKCKIAFVNPGGPTIWDHLKDDPDRYIYAAVKHGSEHALPREIAAGIGDVAARSQWNRPAPAEFALPTEIWREVVARRGRYDEVRKKLAAGVVREINDFITLNLDIRQFAQDVIERSEGAELLRAFWNAIRAVTVLDPTCGSGAFLFAALNILEPLYETCLSRMEAFVADRERATGKVEDSPKGFRDVLEKIKEHPNARYFTLKSIILNNLFGVDIMEEAVEICKLRLFLKLAAQVEPDQGHENLGIEPLPDVDFNIRVGNTLVGYATYEEAEWSAGSDLYKRQAFEQVRKRAADAQQAFDAFRARQMEGDGSVPPSDKTELHKRLKNLDNELNHHLAASYGIQTTGDTFDRWVKTHQPFHWFVEFHRIMRDGGFDVLVGNPPFVEYAKIKSTYSVKNTYRTFLCGNIFTLILERSFILSKKTGLLSLICPLSIVSTSRTDAVRALLQNFPTWLSSYDMRPSSLFEGIAQRLTIVIARNQQRQPQESSFVGGYRRWVADERHALLALTSYIATLSNPSGGPIPKFFLETERSILNKISGPRVETIAVKRGANPVYVHRIVRYFIKSMNFVPLFIDVNGNRGRSVDYKEFLFDAEHKESVAALLNSSLFYWFWRTHSDGFHCGYNDVYSMPYKKIDNKSEKKKLKNLFDHLMNDMNVKSEVRAIQTKSGRIKYQEFYPAKSKFITDKIDSILSVHYGFSDIELDYILNYDIKYRLGRSAEEGVEDE